MFSRIGLWLLFLGSFASAFGCVSPGVRRSAIRWNIQSAIDPAHNRTKALRLAGRPTRELHQLMATKPSPAPCDLVGKWYGVNKGYGAAIAGIHQDVKVFRECEHGVSGYNILVEQVAVEELACKGWRPKLERKTCQPKTMGNFVVDCQPKEGCPCQQALVLDYSQADNPVFDPSRFLVDELVVIEPDLLLGRARFRMGWIDMPVAYFVLTR
jgi:hypothetical protein